MIPWLDPEGPPWFPPTGRALSDPNGLLAAGGSLAVDWLLSAYTRGIFPWFEAGQPILWWSPAPRMVLLPSRFRLHRSLRKRLLHASWETRLDTAFATVIAACADRAEGTWITPEMHQAYCDLHAQGFAHSVEVWQDDTLIGGLYGVCLGGVFFGESMFHRATDASKAALARLVWECLARGIALIDCQMHTAHLASLGAEPWPRSTFEATLKRFVPSVPPPERWSPSPMDTAALATNLRAWLKEAPA